MTTMSIDEMKQRILKPRRSTLNASKNNETNSQIQAPSQTQMGGSGGEANPSVEPGSMANQTSPSLRFPAAASVPPFQGVHGVPTPLRVPKPSELFGISAGLPRPPPPGTAPHPTLQRLPESSGISTVPHLPAPGILSAASVTRQREHDRRLRALSTKMQRENLKRRMEASQGLSTPTIQWSPHPPLEGSLAPDILASPLSGGAWPGILSGLKQWITGGGGQKASEQSGPSRAPEHDVGVHLEFDTDVVDALVYTVGRWMGLDTDQLRDSPGLRTLVSRNIQWFRASPDWMKLLGLVLAKKLNHSLDTPRRSHSDTQRMLMERLLQVAPDATGGQGTSEAVSDVEASTPPPVVVTAPATKKRKHSETSTKRPRIDVPKNTKHVSKKPKKDPKKTPTKTGAKKPSKAPKKTERRGKKRCRFSPDPTAEPASESPTVSLDMAPVVSNPSLSDSDDKPSGHPPPSVLYPPPTDPSSHRDWESE